MTQRRRQQQQQRRRRYTYIQQLRMLRRGSKQAPHGDAAAAACLTRRRRRLVLRLRVRRSRRRVDDVLRALAVDLRAHVTTGRGNTYTERPLHVTLVSMLVPPFSLTSSSCAFCITARNFNNA